MKKNSLFVKSNQYDATTASNLKSLQRMKTIFSGYSPVLLAVFAFILTSFVSTAQAGATYANVGSGNVTLNITSSTANIISRNDDWTGHPSVEGYCGINLTQTHGVDPQTVLGTEYANNALPGASPCVNANKQNPSAFNTGGVTEFDSGPYLAIGFQGNVQANPYLVFYLNTVGQTRLYMTYDVMDIDNGTNNSVSPVALQYRIGETGLFTNIPDGYVADGTDGPNAVGRKTSKFVTLPAAVLNQPKVQLRLISTNAAAPDGTSTPDEWIGINNIVVTNQTPTAAGATISGRATTSFGKSLSRTLVTMFDSTGGSRSVVTNSFGYYRFDNVTVGESYVFTAFNKRYAFLEPTRLWNVTEDYDDLNFIAAW